MFVITRVGLLVDEEKCFGGDVSSPWVVVKLSGPMEATTWSTA